MKKKIVLELDDRYFNQKDLSEATLNYLTNQGHKCELLDYSTIIIDGYTYTLKEWNINVVVPLQQVILTLVK